MKFSVPRAVETLVGRKIVKATKNLKTGIYTLIPEKSDASYLPARYSAELIIKAKALVVRAQDADGMSADLYLESSRFGDFWLQSHFIDTDSGQEQYAEFTIGRAKDIPLISSFDNRREYSYADLREYVRMCDRDEMGFDEICGSGDLASTPHIISELLARLDP